MKGGTMIAALAAVAMSGLGAGPTLGAGADGQLMKVQSRPSFSCSRARTRVEHLICGDVYLGQLDRRMATAYAAFLRRISTSEQARLRENQRLWLADRSQCTTVDCLSGMYTDRIAWLEGFGRY